MATTEEYTTLYKEGVKKFKELLASDTAELALDEDGTEYDVGDIVGASDPVTGVSIAAAVTKKIVTISGDTIKISYKAGV